MSQIKIYCEINFFKLCFAKKKSDLSNEIIKRKHEIYSRECGMAVFELPEYVLKKPPQKLVCLLNLTRIPLVIAIEKVST